MRRRIAASAFVMCLSVAALPAAQDPPPVPQGAPTFRTGVDLVALSVTVTDQQQKYVAGLTSHDFQVFEDGVMQDVSFFSASETPLDLAVLIDTSASMGEKLPLAQTAATGLIHALHGGDRAAVIDLKDRVNVTQPFTSDRAKLEAAIRSTAASGGTALYNGVYVALKQFAALTHDDPGVRRQAIVVLSDGEDTASLLSFEDVLEQAKRSGVTIYTVSLKSRFAILREQSGHTYFSQSDYSMKTLALETGARSFFPLEARELPAVYATIAEELESQYALGYQPHNARADGGYRKVIVRVLNRPDARPRTRTGYFAAAPIKAVASASGGRR